MSDNMYLDLMREWCDTLLEHQYNDPKNPAFYGGFLCPACSMVHGRIGDAMYPLVYLYSKTGDVRYYEAAQKVYQWVQHNVRRPGGMYLNDKGTLWYGTTTFFQTQLGELLWKLPDYIEKPDYDAWEATFTEVSEFIYQEIAKELYWNINYRVAVATCMAIAWRVLGDVRYLEKAHEFAEIAKQHILADGMLYGEGHPSEGITPKGVRPVDLVYNTEETLPNLVTYLRYIDADPEMEALILKTLDAHLEFMLPDGAWDNSWGTRLAKWTYWGGRTTEGCQGAYGMMADKNAQYFEAAHRSFELFRRCTKDGLLTGGMHYEDADEKTCIHHTFCHIKALIPLVERGEQDGAHLLLPREAADGVRHFPTTDVTMLARGDFRATCTACDFNTLDQHTIPTGGALTMLYHKKVGPILAGTINEYNIVEPYNLQVPKQFKDICQTPRIEVVDGNQKYRSTCDTTAKVDYKDEAGVITYRSMGVLKTFMLSGETGFETAYRLDGKSFVISASTDTEDARYILPVIATSKDVLQIDKNTATIKTEQATIRFSCSHPVIHDTTNGARIFNPCGGFNTAWLVVKMPRNTEITIKITVE